MARADSTLVRLPQKRPVQELHGSLFRVFNPFRVFLEFGMHSESRGEPRPLALPPQS